MGTCKHCMFWDHDPSEIRKEKQIAGSCTLAGRVDGIATHPTSLAIAHDNEDYGAWLETSPDFGLHSISNRSDPLNIFLE